MDDTFSTESLRAVLGARPFRFYAQVDSTQDLARTWALDDPDLPAGAVVIAEEQTAGRGRQGRPWLSPPGSGILCSVILRPHVIPERLPRVTMAGGVAVADTLAPFLPDAVALKWPNDVLVRGRKICGILTEASWIGERLAAVILGIGLNVRTDFTATDLAGHATALEIELDRLVNRHMILANLPGHVDNWTLDLHDPRLVEVWRNWLGTLGKRVTIYPQAGDAASFDGVAEAVDEDGALLVRLDSGDLRRVLAADVGLVET